MSHFLKTVDALKAALPRLLDAYNALIHALEHVVFRLALLGFFAYGIYRAVSCH